MLSLPVEGLMDIHITLGELETKNFGNTQDSLRRNHMLHFVMVRLHVRLRTVCGL
jgi:hypothetical protein